MRFFFFLFCIFLGSTNSLFCKAPTWEKLTGCTLLSGKWRDGDSFHVKYEGKEYIFRLYFVDTLEDEIRFPERIQKQAQYFGIKPEQALQIGHRAAEYTYHVLNGKRFTVWTCWQDAMGSSHQQRFYAFVDVGGTPLSSLLVANGLARVYGKAVVLPENLDSAGNYQLKLEMLQTQAKNQKKGGWKESTTKNESFSDNANTKSEKNEELVGSGSEIPAF